MHEAKVWNLQCVPFPAFCTLHSALCLPFQVARSWLEGRMRVAWGWLVGRMKVACGWLVGAYQLASRWLGGGLEVALVWLWGGLAGFSAFAAGSIDAALGCFARLCAVSRLNFRFLLSAFAWWRLCPPFRGSKLEAGNSRFGVHHKCFEYNRPFPPPSGWSGGTLDISWTCAGTIEPPQTPVFDQPSLSRPLSGGISVAERFRCGAALWWAAARSLRLCGPCSAKLDHWAAVT